MIFLCNAYWKAHMSWVAQVWKPSIQESESHREILSQKRNTRKHLKGNRQTVSGIHGWCTEVKVQPSVATPLGQGFGPHELLCFNDSVSKTGRDFCRCSFGFRTSHYTQEGSQHSREAWWLDLREGCWFGGVHAPQKFLSVGDTGETNLGVGDTGETNLFRVEKTFSGIRGRTLMVVRECCHQTLTTREETHQAGQVLLCPLPRVQVQWAEVLESEWHPEEGI